MKSSQIGQYSAIGAPKNSHSARFLNRNKENTSTRAQAIANGILLEIIR